MPEPAQAFTPGHRGSPSCAGHRMVGPAPVASLLLGLLFAIAVGCGSTGELNAGEAGNHSQQGELARQNGAADRSPQQIIEDAAGRSREQVRQAARSDDPFIRANAIEAAQRLEGRITPLLQLGLEDDHPAVRFAALSSIGKLREEELLSGVRHVLEQEQENEAALRRELRDRQRRLSDRQRSRLHTQVEFSRSVQAAAYFALARCEADVDLTPMASLLASPDPSVRGNAAMLLGYLGDESAVPLLEEVAQMPVRRAGDQQRALVRVQIAEAILRLEDESALDTLRAAAYSRHHEVRVLAIETLGELGDRGMEGGLEEIVLEDRNNMELRLAAVWALARFGGSRGVELAYDAAESDDWRLRVWAARTLGLMEDAAAANRLVALLEDPNERVRLQAAASVLAARG